MPLIPQLSLVKKISTSVIVLFLMGITNATFAQETATSGEIKGRLIDSETHNPIEFATVSLINKASGSVVGNQTTMGDGVFWFKGLKWESYQLKITLVGYQADANENIELNNQTLVVDLGDWTMQAVVQ